MPYVNALQLSGIADIKLPVFSASLCKACVRLAITQTHHSMPVIERLQHSTDAPPPHPPLHALPRLGAFPIMPLLGT